MIMVYIRAPEDIPEGTSVPAWAYLSLPVSLSNIRNLLDAPLRFRSRITLHLMPLVRSPHFNKVGAVLIRVEVLMGSTSTGLFDQASPIPRHPGFLLPPALEQHLWQLLRQPQPVAAL